MEAIHIRFVLEILGRPPEHIKEALEKLIENMSKEKDIKILSKVVHEPVIAKDAKDLFTTFAEVEAELATVGAYFSIIFSYFPSNIEIISPTELKLQAQTLNEVGGVAINKIHEYEAITKTLIGQNQILARRMQEIDAKFLKESFEKKLVQFDTSQPAPATNPPAPGQAPAVLKESMEQKPKNKKKK